MNEIRDVCDYYNEIAETDFEFEPKNKKIFKSLNES